MKVSSPSGLQGMQMLIACLLALGISGCSGESPTPGTATDSEITAGPSADASSQDLVDLPATDLAAALGDGSLDAASVTRAFIQRIEALDRQGPALRAVLEVNAEAPAEALALDATRARGDTQGPLHGVPVLIKGNIDVAGLTGGAGSLALADYPATTDADLVQRLRKAGAVILGTANLSEWANFRDANSSSGWSSIGGQIRNPYVLDRNPCGSSGGSAVAVAARLTPLAVGTETNGSIVCPAGANGVVGIKPTVGLVSQQGIIPISHTQDTAGPIARSVTGAAMLLQAMRADDDVGLAAADLAPDPTLTHLQGRRIGVLRSYRGAGERPRVEAIFENARARLEVLRAELVDPIEYALTPAMRGASYRILLREFKAGLNDYLAGRGLPDDRDSLADLITFNRSNRGRVMPYFDQSIFLDAEAMNGLDDPEHAADVAMVQDGLRADLSALFETHDLDALFMPVTGPAWKTDWTNGDNSSFGGTAYLAAISGFPGIVIPAGMLDGLPVSVGFMGLAGEDAQLIQIAYALEQALPAQPAPEFIPSLEQQVTMPPSR